MLGPIRDCLAHHAYDAKNRLEIGSKIDLKSDGSNQNGLNNLEEFLTPFKNV